MHFPTAALLSGFLFLLTISGTPTPAAAGQVQSVDAELGVRAPDAPGWQTLTNGARLPDRGELLSGAVGITRIDMGGARFWLDHVTRIDFDEPGRRIRFRSGRLLITNSSPAPWTLRVRALRAELARGGVLQISEDRDSAIKMSLVQGTIRITGQSKEQGSASAQGISAPHQWRHIPERDTWKHSKLSADQLTSITSWATRKKDPQGLGQLLVRDSQSDTLRRLNIARYHVNVVLRPPVALVQIDQAFYNPYDEQQEGTFVFNLPAGAAVSRFAMYVTRDQLVEGELIERERARRVYDWIVSGRRDPAILEQIGDNLFRMRVFPIFSRDTKHILLDYTLPLESLADQVHFCLPLMSDLKPVWDFQIGGSIHGVPPGQITTLSQANVKYRTVPGGTSFVWQERSFRPPEFFALSFQGTAKPQSPQVRSVTVETPVDQLKPGEDITFRKVRYFQVSLPTIEQDDGRKSLPPRDVLILVDTSSAVRGFGALKRCVKLIVQTLRPQDRWRIGCVDRSYRPLSSAWLAADTGESRAALNRLAQEFRLGATDLEASVSLALESLGPPDEERVRHVVYLGDGDITYNLLSEGGAVARLTKRCTQVGTRFWAVALGSRGRGQHFLESLALNTGGVVFDLAKPPERRDLLQWLLAGMPLAIRAELTNAVGLADTELIVDHNWLPQRPVRFVGRAAGDHLGASFSVRLHRGRNSRVHLVDLPPQDSIDDLFVGRLWAQQKMHAFMGQSEDPNDATSETAKKIVRLSQEWSLLSPHTAFLVLESERDYARWNIDRRLRHKYWKPAEHITSIPLSNDWLREVRPAGDERMTQRLVKQARDAVERQEYDLTYRLLEGITAEDEGGLHRSIHELREAAIDGLRTTAVKELAAKASPLLGSDAWPKLLHEMRNINRHLTIAGPIQQTDRLDRELLQDINIDADTNNMTIEKLAWFIEHHVSSVVDIDLKAIDRSGIRLSDTLDCIGYGRLSLRSYVDHVLKQLDLFLVRDDDRLLITTDDQLEEYLTTSVYPVADLLMTNRRVPPDALFFGAFAEHLNSAERRIYRKLDQPISLNLRDVKLVDALWFLSEQIEDNVLVDHQALSDIGLDVDRKVSVRARNIPARIALRRALRDLELDYFVDREAIVITSPEEKEENLRVRLHSGDGILTATRGAPQFGGDFGFGGFGMGGMAGGFGGMGGGMGGMGGGGLGGGVGFAGARRAGPSGASGASNGGDGSSIPALLEDEPSSTVGDTGESDNANPAPDAAAEEPRTPGESEFTIDWDTPIDQITSIITPSDWDDVGGASCIEGFDPTMDFVVRGSDEQHREIESLFARLRELPREDLGSDIRLADPPVVNTASNADADSLIEVITSVVQPDEWDEVGGMNSVEYDPYTLSLLVSADQQTHRELHTLLTRLRRSRFATRHGARELLQSTLESPQSVTRFDNGAAMSELPAATEAELRLLKVRRRSTEDLQTWRISENQKEQGDVTWGSRDQRVQFEQPGRTVCIDDLEAAAYYSDLALVEIGPWGDAARRELDRLLPWWPHRSNQELARLFEIQRVRPKDDADQVVLRLTPVGLDETSHTYLKAAFHLASGLPLSIRAYVDGREYSRLEFQLDESSTDGPAFRNVTLFDSENEVRRTWRLTGTRQLPSEMPTFSDEWQNAATLDVRPDREPGNSFRAALNALGESRWGEAREGLTVLLGDQPKQPLYAFLRARAYQQDGGRERIPNYRDRMISDLRLVATSGANRLISEIATEQFSALPPGQLLDVALLQPAEDRSGDDLRRLAELALAAGRLNTAFELIEQGQRQDAGGQDIRLQWLLLQVLLQAERLDQAEVAATRLLALDRSGSPLPEVAKALADHGLTEVADQLLHEALSNPNREPPLTDSLRANLLRARADLHTGYRRWEVLVELIERLPRNSERRQKAFDQLLGELHQPEHCAAIRQLVTRTTDDRLRFQLTLARAELTLDLDARADLCKQLMRHHRMKPNELAWAAAQLNRAGQCEHVIAYSEEAMRKGRALDDALLRELRQAYRAVGRMVDSQRAGAQDPKLEELDQDRRPGLRPRGMQGGMF